MIFEKTVLHGEMKSMYPTLTMMMIFDNDSLKFGNAIHSCPKVFPIHEVECTSAM